jgi:hypothetical protein
MVCHREGAVTHPLAVRFTLLTAIVVPLAGAAVLLADPAIPRIERPPRRAMPTTFRAIEVAPLAVSLERGLSKPLFRRGRKPARTAFDPDRPGGEEAVTESPTPKPVPSLSGILWSPEPVAVLEGVPGAAGSTVMRPGERKAGLTLRRIRQESVTLEGFDTTWVLTLREP